MAEDLDPLATEGAVISNRSILITMAALVGLGSVAGLFVGGPRAGVGVFFGGLLGFANYWWLDRVTKAMFSPDGVTSSGLLAAKYVSRYVVIGGILLLVYLSGAVPVAAVIAGLGAFALAVVIQGIRSIL
jgi:hypothetical protein